MTGGSEVGLDFYGVTLQVSCSHAPLLEDLARDFSYFVRHGARRGPPGADLRVHLAEPPWGGLPRLRSVLVQPGFCAYQRRSVRYVDYQGRALARWDFADESGDLWGTDPELLHEVAYLLVHSRAGELLDRRGLHRVHALALDCNGSGALCLLPSGGGKTTLALAALELPGVRLLGDDMALVSRRGLLSPFPLRLGFRAPPDGVDPRRMRRMRRRQHGDKWLLDLQALGGRVAPGPVQPRLLLVGERQLAGPARLERAARSAAAGPLLREMVVGLGLPQLIEYFLRSEPLDLAAKGALAASRAVAATALVLQSRTFRLLLSRDSRENISLIRQALSRIPGCLP